ncbi:MAG: Cj0069 family protein [Alphaproteobacteria bacterium]|nr:Cj0069 family protein [Alphaproteobacteria bacterium]
MDDVSGHLNSRIAVLWRGDPAAPHVPVAHEARLTPVVEALRAAGFAAEGVVWFDDAAEATLARLAAFAGVLVWINPLADGRDRSVVDAALRELATRGVWVSAHPDVIASMGTKAVLFRTRALGWGSDTDLYDTAAAFEARFWPRVADGAVRVLKPLRGNDGQGVVRVTADGGRFSVQHAGDDRVEMLERAALSARVREVVARAGAVIDQAFHDNLAAGMVRCYLSLDRVVGFAEQRPRREAGAFGMNSAKTMHDADAPAFADLRRAMEMAWVPGLQRILGIGTAELPALWDADFLYRVPAEAAALGRFVLCEINASCVSPFPPGGPGAIAEAAGRFATRRSTSA